MRVARLLMLVVCLALSGTAVQAQPATGTLAFQIAEFTSEIQLPSKVERQLKTGGVEWGIHDNLLVVTMVAKQFINYEINQFTRFGASTSLTLPAGDYQLTTVGIVPKTAFSAQKMLERGAYFNENVLTFHIDPGKTTTLAVRPVVQRKATFFLNFYQAALLTSVVTEAGKSEEISISEQTPASVAWPAYNGPLKFVPAK